MSKRRYNKIDFRIYFSLPCGFCVPSKLIPRPPPDWNFDISATFTHAHKKVVTITANTQKDSRMEKVNERAEIQNSEEDGEQAQE